MAKAKKIKARRIQRRVDSTVAFKSKSGQTSKTKKHPSKGNSDGFRYAKHHTILLIGEGNFSFARSIATRLGSGTNIVATALDSEATVKEKYAADAESHIKEFKRLGGTVIFGIDGTKLKRYKQLRSKRFSRIVFNFPHTGSGDKDEARNIMLNQQLLLDFFSNVRGLLTDGIASSDPRAGGTVNDGDHDDSNGSSYSSGSDGEDKGKGGSGRKKRKLRWQGSSQKANSNIMEFEGVQAQVTYDIDSDSDQEETAVPEQERGQVHVTLKSGKPYDMWRITKLARQCGLVTLSAYPFRLTAYPGYEHRRTLGFKEGLSTDDNQEIRDKKPKVYVFAAGPDMPKEDTDGSARHSIADVTSGRGQQQQQQERQRKRRK
ncbi:hypothetical protein H4R20_003717 [Coemansia guatemalensis]|uniref:25S rRNA (uridine-N(3))-methyltransferase BMT5-like domain-containing protein n=1 Tax=Coemansia guatemalensis TaxID=2761395 RepID=A0A9W8I004_9FUNG|nr:hypothetical protein H4R20_003717 [Coemansia guatemalensis]